MQKINDSHFETEVINSDKLTIVDFGATWCGPCKKLHPIMDELASEFGEKIKVVEVDVGEAPQTAVKFGVTSLPQLLFFKGGKVMETVIGLNPKSKIHKKIEQYLG